MQKNRYFACLRPTAPAQPDQRDAHRTSTTTMLKTYSVDVAGLLCGCTRRRNVQMGGIRKELQNSISVTRNGQNSNVGFPGRLATPSNRTRTPGAPALLLGVYQGHTYPPEHSTRLTLGCGWSLNLLPA